MLSKSSITVRTVAENPEYLITSHLADVPSQELVVTFGYQGTGIAPTGFGIDFLTKRGYDAVYVSNRKLTAYQGLDAGVLADALRPLLDNRKVFTYGSSLGGYCALYYAGVLSARALAMSPRNSKHPIHTRGRIGADEWTHEPDLARLPLSPHRPTIVFDNLHLRDSSFVRDWATAAYPDAQEVHVPLSGHKTSERLRDMGRLKDLVLACLREEVLPGKIDGFPEGSSQLALIEFYEAVGRDDLEAARIAAFKAADTEASGATLKIIWKHAMKDRDLPLCQNLVNAAAAHRLSTDRKALGILHSGRKMGLAPEGAV